MGLQDKEIKKFLADKIKIVMGEGPVTTTLTSVVTSDTGSTIVTEGYNDLRVFCTQGGTATTWDVSIEVADSANGANWFAKTTESGVGASSYFVVNEITDACRVIAIGTGTNSTMTIKVQPYHK